MIILLLAISSLVLSGIAQGEGNVARAIVTTGVVDREPINDLDRVLEGNEKVFFFTELSGMKGETIKHRWSHGDEVLAEVEFNVGGPRWRIWSSKKLMAEWTGGWKVEVLDGEGNVISEKSFDFVGDRNVTDSDEETGAAETPATE